METDIKIFDFNKDLDIEFEIKELSLVFKLKSIFSKPHKASFHQLIWVDEGQAIFYIDFRKVIVKAGNLLVIAANQIVEFDIKSAYNGKLILFTDTFFNQTELDTTFLQTSEILNPAMLNQLAKWDINQFNTIIELIVRELSLYQPNFTQQSIIQSYLRIILFNTERIIKDQSLFNINKDITRDFFNLVEISFKHHHNVEFYLTKLAIGKNKLVRTLKEQIRYTPKQYLENRIILEAKRLLIYNRNLNIKEISFELGFDEPTNFTKFFRRKAGISPYKFRESEIERLNKK